MKSVIPSWSLRTRSWWSQKQLYLTFKRKASWKSSCYHLIGIRYVFKDNKRFALSWMGRWWWRWYKWICLRWWKRLMTSFRIYCKLKRSQETIANFKVFIPKLVKWFKFKILPQHSFKHESNDWDDNFKIRWAFDSTHSKHAVKWFMINSLVSVTSIVKATVLLSQLMFEEWKIRHTFWDCWAWSYIFIDWSNLKLRIQILTWRQ